VRINRSGNYIVRGQTTENLGPKRINVFDGTYKSGFRVVRFTVAGELLNADNETQGKITTEEVTSGADEWNWENQVEIGWATSNMFTTGTREMSFSEIDESMVVVEDLYVYVHSNTSANFRVNYLIELEPVDLAEFQYAMAYIQNQSQG